MIKKPIIKSQDKDTNRSILKSNSPRQICSSSSQTKVGNGIFRRASLWEEKNTMEGDQRNYIRETRSEPLTQIKDHKSIVSVGGLVHL